MIDIYELDGYPLSDRNGTYGGAAGSKEGILIDGEYWLVKYPQKTIGMRNVDISYTTAPLSEYIGSHIYEILGYDTHKTILGMRNGKLVVACKDFCDEEGSLREVRTLKNIYNKDIEARLDLTNSLYPTGDRHHTDLNVLLLHLKYNQILSSVDGIKERFWECAVIDVLINNNDRNNGNWGVLKKGNKYYMAPIFDNGASFFNKMDISSMESVIADESAMKQKAMSVRTAYAIEDKPLFARQLLSLDNDDLKKAIFKITPAIKEHLPDFYNMLQEIPENYGEHLVMSSVQKDYYMKMMESNFGYLIEPAYESLMEYRHATEVNNEIIV